LIRPNVAYERESRDVAGVQADEAGDGHRGQRDSIATSGIRVGSVPVTSGGAKMLATAVVALGM